VRIEEAATVRSHGTFETDKIKNKNKSRGPQDLTWPTHRRFLAQPALL
jgi:hypothetical protein